MPEENRTEYKKYSQHMMGQFRKTSKKAQAMFIGRSIQLLGDSVEKFRESKKLRMETLRYTVEETKAMTEDGKEVDGWIVLRVAYEVGSMDPYTEEDRKRDEERLMEARERQKETEAEEGEEAMKALERQIYPPKAEDRIQ